MPTAEMGSSVPGFTASQVYGGGTSTQARPAFNAMGQQAAAAAAGAGPSVAGQPAAHPVFSQQSIADLLNMAAQASSTMTYSPASQATFLQQQQQQQRVTQAAAQERDTQQAAVVLQVKPLTGGGEGV